MDLTEAVVQAMGDIRRQASCDHSLLDIMLKQRIYGLALGYEDWSDHSELRQNLTLQTATSRVETLASPLTLCRLEQRYVVTSPWMSSGMPVFCMASNTG